MRQALPMVLLPGNLLDALPSLQERESSACPAPSPPGHLPQNFPKQQLSWCSAAFMCCSVRCGQKKRHRTSSGKQSPSCLQILETGGAAHEEGHMRNYQHLWEAAGAEARGSSKPEPLLGFPREKQGRAELTAQDWLAGVIPVGLQLWECPPAAWLLFLG